jgi:hypothetical protein
LIAIITGVLSSLIVAALYTKLRSKLEFLKPNDHALRELIAEHDKSVAHLQVKLQSAFLLPLLVWLFLGNLFWALGGLLDIFRYRAYEYIELLPSLEAVRSVNRDQAFAVM